ncbi:MAG: LEA type 2 family protein [Cyclobacteriaceae bacterium]|nr:LEA type 2 family protein [Cyclobacteriaceae bacterium]
MKKHYYLIALITLFLFSNAMSQETPEFKKLTNVKTSKISGTDITFTADAVFYNPNDVGLKLKSVEIDVIIEGKKAGHVSQIKKIKILPNANFTVPLTVDVDLQQIDIMEGLFGMMSGKKMRAEFIGDITVSKNAIPMKVPVKHTEYLTLNL